MRLKTGYPLLAAGLAILLAGCFGDAAVVLDGNRLTAPMPADIRRIASLANTTLQFRVSVNGELQRSVPVTGANDASTIVNIPAGRNNELYLAWYAIEGTTAVLLADLETTVEAGTTELNVSDYTSTGPGFDLDGDRRTNLSEARENRNLLSAFDVQVPLQTSFGGAFEDLSADGIDEDVSNDAPEDDSVTTMALRHDGTELVVYICGQDQTLQGDNSALDGDGQYWHDDTVFIYVDGADSDNSSYDGFDDFQFAFVRSTQQMIVSKGGDNPFCGLGSCVRHNFLPSGNSACEYELEVFLSFADLNISLGEPVGFDVEITDDDNGGLREGSEGWIGDGDRSDRDPSTFGTIRLN